MPAPRRLMLSVSLAATALLAAGCAKATVVGAPWGTPLEAVTAAAESLAEGVSFRGWTTTDGGRLDVHGDDVPAEQKLRHYQSAEVATGAQLITEVRRIGSDVWLQITGPTGDGTGWGHFADGESMLVTGGQIPPSTWVPELLAQITEIEWTEERTYGGVLDLTAADPDKTGLGHAIASDLPDEAEEVGFTVLLNTDGTLNTLTYEIDDTKLGDIEITFSFTLHGSPNDVTKPDGKIVEVTDGNAVDWYSGF